MRESKFVYVTYIATTPEKVFEALTKGEVTRRYWGHENVSDWKPGSPWKHQATDGSGTVRILGEVVESTPPRRLVLTWAFPADAANKAKRTRVTFEIERVEDMVRLTVTHDDLEPGSEMDRGIREGWPRVLASLKTFLETGKPLNTWAGKK
ncbi:MAG TPA: SRPBCC family protein [Burkholderiales bacterium]|nr:SRPBCC family protein [Burkholderiales bacterium]